MSKFFFQLKSLQKMTPQQLNLLKTDLEWWINLLVPLSGRKIQTNNKNLKQFLKCIYHLLQECTKTRISCLKNGREALLV